MDSEKTATSSEQPAYTAHNYCACFIDILGQRQALSGQGLLPEIRTEEERLQFIREVVAKTIRPITRLQSQADQIMKGLLKSNEPTRQSLPADLRKEWDKLLGNEVQLQYWSDGLVAFSCLGDKETSMQINGAFTLLSMAGALCFRNLSNLFRNPLRGGVDIAWGTELRPGELYGPVIARSYELESEVAQYPRIVVGKRMIDFLNTVASLEPTNNHNRYSAIIAKKCRQMLIRDRDGQWMIHYLGPAFKEVVSGDGHTKMYVEALQFVDEEYSRFCEAGHSKLAWRYNQLLSYFHHFPPEGYSKEL